MRRVISAVLVAVSLVAITGVGAVAQTEPEPAIVPAGLNADKVDGRHAVGHRASRRKRAGKLVATNKQGFLPSTIIRPSWRLILGKPGGFADGVDNEGVTGVRLYQRSTGHPIQQEDDQPRRMGDPCIEPSRTWPPNCRRMSPA